MKQQNTHWYRAIGDRGATADPMQALSESVERVGLHDCTTQGCEETHACNAEWYYTKKIVASQT